MDSTLELLILVLAAFVPSLIYLVWMRNAERFGREPYGRLLRIFLFGAVFSVMIAVLLELVLMVLLHTSIGKVYEILGTHPSLEAVILAVIIAPVVEEFTKVLGVFRARRFISDIEDGIVFGAAVGLGFAATENLLYESDAWFNDGAEAFIMTTIVRSLSSALLHASASSVAGLGVARSHRGDRSWFPYYVGAVVMHAAFNLAASLGLLYEETLGPSAYLIGLVSAFVIAIAGITGVRAKIRDLEGPARMGRRVR